MYENLVGQTASQSLISDIEKKLLPQSILFAGNTASGKLTAALETARILSCRNHNNPSRSFNCNCPSCLQQKALTCSNLVLCGPRDCMLEINAASDTFLKAYSNNESYLVAARYLFLRSVRKLTLRFSDVLMKDDDKVKKIGAVIAPINDNLEVLDFPRNLPSYEETEKLVSETKELCGKLENEFLYNSIPVNQIRNIEAWARIRSEEGKKTVIIENADRMTESVRNALLKILEEPPADCVFILLTSRRNAVIPTILSRLRTYNFINRPVSIQNEVISRVFHNTVFNGPVEEFLLTYLPVSPTVIRENARDFVFQASKGTVPEISTIIKNCGGFDPKIELQIFLEGINVCLKNLLKSQAGCEALAEVSEKTLEAWNNITVYNQGCQASLENLFRELLKINRLYGNVFSLCFQ